MSHRSLRRAPFRGLVSLVAALAAASSSAPAATFTWVGLGLGNNWSTSLNWSGNVVPANDGTAMIEFGGIAVLSPNISSVWSIDSLTFVSGAGAFTLGGSTLTVGAGGITNAASNLQTVSAPIVVGAAQTWDSGSAGLTVSGIVSGSANLTKTGTGTLFLSGANTFTGTLTVTRGTVHLGANPAATTGSLVVNSQTAAATAAFDFDDADVTFASVQLGGTGGTATSTSNIVGNNGTLTLSGGLTFDATNNPLGSTIAGRLSLAAGNRTFTIGDSTNAIADVTISRSISGSGNLVKTGPGTLVLSATNSYSGDTIVNRGTLQLGANQSAATTNLVVRADSAATPTFDLNGNNATFTNITLGGITGFVGNIATGAGTLTVSNSIVYDATNNPPSATLGVSLEIGSGTVTIDVGNSSAAHPDLLISSMISGGGGLLKTGTGTLTLSGASTYDGGLKIAAGTVIVSNFPDPGASSPFGDGTSPLQLGDGTSAGAIEYTGAGDTSSRDIDLTGTTGNGKIISSGAGALILTGNLSTVGIGNKFLELSGSNTGANRLDGPISDGSAVTGLIKSGSGTWTLNTSSSFTGDVKIYEGILKTSSIEYNGTHSALGAGSNIGFGNGSDSGTLLYEGSGTSTDRNIILAGTTGGASILNNGTGGIRLSGAFSAPGLGAKSFTLGGSNTDDNYFDGDIVDSASGATSLVKTGTGSWILAGTNTYTGGTLISDGTLYIGYDTPGTLPGNATNHGTLIFSRSDTYNYAGVISGTGSVFQKGNGELSLTGLNTFTGEFGVLKGTVSFSTFGTPGVSGPFGAGSSPIQLGSGESEGQLKYTGTGTSSSRGFDLAGDYGNGKISNHGTGALTLSGNLIASGPGAKFFILGGNNTGNNVFSGTISDSGGGYTGLKKQDAGTWTVSGTSTFTGDVELENGTLIATSLANSGTSSALGAGTALRFNASSGSPVLSYTGGTTSSNRSIDFYSDATILANGSGPLTLTGTFNISRSSSFTLTLGGTNTGNNTISSVIPNSGYYNTYVEKIGAGTWVLSGANLYSGYTTVTAGTLALGANNVLEDTSGLYVNGGTFALGGFNDTVGSVSGNGGNITGPGTLTSSSFTFNHAGSALVSALLAGPSANLTMSGGGVLTLSGANTFAGSVQIQHGTIEANTLAATGSANSLGAGTSALELGSGTNSGTLAYTGSGSTTNRNIVLSGTTGGGTLAANGTGNVTFSGTVTAATGGNKILTLAGTHTGNNTLSGIISDPSGGLTTALVKSGAGTWQLSGANTFTGGVTINGGILSFAANNALFSGGNVVVDGATSATFGLNGTSQSIGTLTFGGAAATSSSVNTVALGAGTLTLGGNVTYLATGNPLSAVISGGTLALGAHRTFAVSNSTSTISELNVSSVIAGSGFGLTKTGAGRLFLTGANTYNGGTVVNAGELYLGAANALAAGSNVTINANVAGSAALIVGGGFNQNIGTLAIGGAGGTASSQNLFQIDTGSTVTLGGNVAYDATGNPLTADIFSGGTLALGATRTFDIADSSSTATELRVYTTVSGTGFGVTKTGAGRLALYGTNTFTGPVEIRSGSLEASILAAGGSFSSLGAGTGAISLGYLIDSGTLAYTGSGHTTDRALVLAGTTGGGTLSADGTGPVVFSGSISAAGGGNKLLTLAGTNTGNNTVSGVISDPSGFTTAVAKTGTGTWVVSGTNTYSGGTTVSGGTLIASTANGLGTGSITLDGGSLRVANGISLPNSLAFGSGGGTIGGNATIAGPVPVGPNVVLSPGDSPGTLTFNGALNWAGGGSYTVDLLSATGATPGTTHDTLVVTGAGSFAVSATSGSPFTLNLISLSSALVAGNISDFTSSGTYAWQIASSVNPITGFNANAFAFNTSGFTNSTGLGTFYVSLGGSGGNTAILLNFTPIPEPSTWALLLAGAALVGFLEYRRRR
ncbi:MAG: hypothetical protein B9S34_02635 [Opitutia bacterium Tous-C1TDCM]|nr:MAG: hypothetical protein B9S34_02635 [Opitutae bacterium Tous-C1TDCM]